MSIANQERLLTVVLRPVISEKATMVADKQKQVVFEVLRDATKAEIKAAVELLFKDQKVEVESVNIVNQRARRSVMDVSKAAAITSRRPMCA